MLLSSLRETYLSTWQCFGLDCHDLFSELRVSHTCQELVAATSLQTAS